MKKTVIQGNKILFLTVLFYLFTVNCYAFDISIRPKGFVFIPMGEGNTDPAGNKMYKTGGGGEIGFEVDFSTIIPNPIGLGYALGVEAGLMMNPFLNDDEMNISFYNFGGVLGLYYFPVSRLFIRADGEAGVYIASNERGNSNPGFFWRAGGELGFRFTPGFLIAANAGWKQYQITGNSEKRKDILNSGAYAGLTLQLTFQAGSNRSEGINASLNQYGAVFPAYMAIYQKNHVGAVSVRNNENAEIRDVQMYFRASPYTSSEYLCGAVSMIARGRSADIPLLADFSNDILLFTDTGRVIGEIVVRYKFLGKEREVVRSVTVETNDRNSVTKNDTAALAAFVSVTSPEILDFARLIAGFERNNRRTGHNKNLNYAIWVYEAIRNQLSIRNEELGMSNVDVSADETDRRHSSLLIDKVQFPAETLLFRSGTAKDMALLFASCLESVGIGSALIQVTESDVKDGGEILVAISLGVNQGGAETLVNGTDKILIVGDVAYLPLSMSVIKEGFMSAWARGASVLNNAFISEGNVNFVVVQEAWNNFPSAPLPELGRSNIRLDSAVLAREVNNVTQRYIQQEINPIIQRTSGGGAAQQNRLGILLVRAGRIPEARAAYERAAGMGSIPAMTNRGNLALIEKDYAAAERWFRQALQRDAENKTALRGLEKAAVNK